MATHSSVLAWKIPWMKAPVQSMRLQRVGHDWVTSFIHAQWEAIPAFTVVFLGGGQGQDEVEMWLEVPSPGHSENREAWGGQGRLFQSTKISWACQALVSTEDSDLCRHGTWVNAQKNSLLKPRLPEIGGNVLWWDGAFPLRGSPRRWFPRWELDGKGVCLQRHRGAGSRHREQHIQELWSGGQPGLWGSRRLVWPRRGRGKQARPLGGLQLDPSLLRKTSTPEVSGMWPVSPGSAPGPCPQALRRAQAPKAACHFPVLSLSLVKGISADAYVGETSSHVRRPRVRMCPRDYTVTWHGNGFKTDDPPALPWSRVPVLWAGRQPGGRIKTKLLVSSVKCNLLSWPLKSWGRWSADWVDLFPGDGVGVGGFWL